MKFYIESGDIARLLFFSFMPLEPFQMLLIFMIMLSFYMCFQDEASNYPEPIADQIIYDTV